MLHFDPNDPLDRILKQELDDNPVSLDEFLDVVTDWIDSEANFDPGQILRDRGLNKDDILPKAVAYRTDFRTYLMEKGLPLDDRFGLCRQLSQLAQSEPSAELLRIYCDVLCGIVFLLGEEPQDMDEEYENWLCLTYLNVLSERDELLAVFTERRQLAEKFSQVVQQKRSPRPVSCDMERKYAILRCFTECFDMPPKGDGNVLLNNLEAYLQIISAWPVLRSVEPLILFRLLTRRQSYMCSTPDLKVNLSALWKKDPSSIGRNNGKNYKKYWENLTFFHRLCCLYQEDQEVDLPLCWYGLEQITVLGNFYWNEVDDGREYLGQERLMPFLKPIEELVEDSLFSCFENGAGDNIMMEDSGLTCGELEDFQTDPNPLVSRELNKIADYMNDHAVELTNRFSQADTAAVRELCRDVLEQSALSGRVGIEGHVPLFLATINGGLMEFQDYFANQYLIQAGHALTDKPLAGTPEPTE